MTLSLLFWILVIAAFLFAIWTTVSPAAAAPVKASGIPLLLFILIILLGWRVFGPAVHG